MKNYKQNIDEGIKIALKSGDRERRSVLIMLKAALQNEEIAKGKKQEGLSSEEFIVILKREIRKRREAIEQMSSNKDLVEKEGEEIEVLEEFMPPQLKEEEIRKIVKETIAGGLSGVGPIVGAVISKIKGRADGSIVKKIVEDEVV